MIARLRGTVEAIGEHGLILYVSGVGYGVTCSSATLQALEGHTQEVCLWIETLVHPESLQLFGFKTPLERDWFRLLITVQGWGLVWPSVSFPSSILPI